MKSFYLLDLCETRRKNITREQNYLQRNLAVPVNKISTGSLICATDPLKSAAPFERSACGQVKAIV
jgi:hypothetical protein